MASYRDKHNPEGLHFLGSGGSKSFLGCTIIVCMLLIVWAAFTGGPLGRAINILLSLIIIAAAAAAWPKSILLDQRGLTQRHGTGKRLLEWSDLGRIEQSTEFGLPLRKGRFPTQTLRIRSKDGRTSVVHTPRHTDFHRFVFEIQRHGVKLPEELGHITAPNVSRLTSAKEPMPEGLRRRWP
ncbi:MAG: hypothetical protein IH602_19055 [Bryobacteraceae bacterium]|nr:hypothetical protein [Bryobacteraceae bacterium]